VAALDNPCVGAVAPVISAMGQPQQKGFGLRWKGPTLEEAELSLPLYSWAMSCLGWWHAGAQ